MNETIKISGLYVNYKSRDSVKSALRDVNLTFYEGEKAAIVGESGCGKSTLALAIAGLLPQTARVKGSVNAAGVDIYNAGHETLRQARGAKFGMIFQDPGASLNPLFRVREHFEAAIQAHEKKADKTSIKSAAISLLEETGISEVARVYESYPHQLSGGMQQRVMTALALCMSPGILIADEPTTALDATVQAQIAAMLKRLQRAKNLTLVLVTHDLHFAEDLCERIIVMYAGEVVEIFSRGDKPRHHYTRALFNVIPVIGSKKEPFGIIPGEVPEIGGEYGACSFNNRCGAVSAICLKQRPKMTQTEKGCYRCFFPAGD